MNKYDRMVEMVSRTFALSIQNLPGTLKESVGLAYLLFRVSDSIEDHAGLDAEQKSGLLEVWVQVLDGSIPPREFTDRIVNLDGSEPDVFVAQQAGDLIDLLGKIDPALRDYIILRCSESALGMARWQRQGPYVETVEDLDDYMHQVAGLVGYLMTDIYTWYYPNLEEKKNSLLTFSREVGLGLQTVNVIRGLRSDWRRGWMFVPRQYLDKVGISRRQFFEPLYEQHALEVVDMLVDKAQGHLSFGLPYIQAFPRRYHRVRLSNIWPLCFAIKTLTRSRGNLKVIRSEVKITRQDVSQIIRWTTLFAWSNHWLHGYCQRLQRV